MAWGFKSPLSHQPIPPGMAYDRFFALRADGANPHKEYDGYGRRGLHQHSIHDRNICE